MAKHIERINQLLEAAQINLRKSGVDPETIDLLVIMVLKLVNSGQVNGVVQFRIDGHRVYDLRLQDLRLSLDKVLVSESEDVPVLSL